MKTQRHESVYVYSKFDEEWIVVGEYDRLRSMKESIVNREKLR